MARFLAARATPRVEIADGAAYRRTITVKGYPGTLAVAPMDGADALTVDVEIADHALVPGIAERVALMFDVDALPALVAGALGRDTILKRVLKKHAGIRVPGAWDPFELCVRAILGQQITVRAATTFAGRIAARWGQSFDDGTEWLLFPTPAALAEAPLEECGIIRTRAQSIRSLARAFADGSLAIHSPDAIAALREIRGIGKWTADYIAMRALNQKDTLPFGDLVLRRKAANCSARELERRSEKWRPYRSYATMLLWTAD